MRLNKFLADAGVASRRKADVLIQEGKVTINGKRASIGDQVTLKDHICVNGKEIRNTKEKDLYFAFHKPVGVITTMDTKAKQTIMEYFQSFPRLFPVGRLDVATSGLIFLTNDGQFAYTITQAKKAIEKEYVVYLNKVLREKDKESLEKGVIILGKKTAPVSLFAKKHIVHMVLHEGRNRQVRRMFEAVGYEVKKLIRIRIGIVKLDTLKPGTFRKLTKKEIQSFLSHESSRKNKKFTTKAR